MAHQGQPIVDRSDPFNFAENTTLGWVCHCGAAEQLPVMGPDLNIITIPILVSVQWAGSVRTVFLFCTICECRGRQSTLHQVIDVAGTPAQESATGR